MIQYRAVGSLVPRDEYLSAHAELLKRDTWIIDGYGCRQSVWERFASADTLIYIDLPLFRHFLWVTKRLLKGIFVNPEDWPAGSPIISSTMQSYRVLWLCHRHLTPKYRELVSEAQKNKRVYHLRSVAQMDTFLNTVRPEAQRV
jgi:hypothetical protein